MRITLTCFIVLVAKVPVFAAVYERDLFLPGDGLITYDNVNHREWLDLTQTAAVDLAIVRNHLAPGGSWEGFHFATALDVEPLAISAGVKASPESNPYSTHIGREAKKLIRLLGEIIHGENQVVGEINISLGQIVQGFESNVPVFDDSNFFVVGLGDENVPNLPLFAQPSGAYYFSTSLVIPGLPPLGRGSMGPFWLYRQALPEPQLSGLWLVLLVRRKRVRRLSGKFAK